MTINKGNILACEFLFVMLNLFFATLTKALIVELRLGILWQSLKHTARTIIAELRLRINGRGQKEQK